MVKVMENDPRFQMGSYSGQKEPGLYMDGILVELIKILARNIVKDNQFLGLCSSSTFTVRTGKSTLLQQFAAVYIDEVNRTHGLNLTFTHKDIVFNTKDLEKRAFEKHNNGEKYGVLIMDESHGLDEHSFSKVMKRFQRFLKICGMMNFTILVVVPDFFDCPKFLAMNRSNFLLNVKFENEFERGHFEYYNFTDKKKLYVKGKKFHDYSMQKPTLPNGRFVNKYCVDEVEYRKMKEQDMKNSIEEDEEKDSTNPQAVRKAMSEIVGRLYPYLKEKYKVQQKDFAHALGMAHETVSRLYSKYKKDNGLEDSLFSKSTSLHLANLSANEKVRMTKGTSYLEDIDDEVGEEEEPSESDEDIDNGEETEN